MIGAKGKSWLSGGLFAKYVAALVGLVVFVLAVNGATEAWINYRATRAAHIDVMGERAEATAGRIEQSIAELERQISWVTRASVVKLEDHRADYAQLLNQVPAIHQLTLLDGYGREKLRLSRTSIAIGSGADFSRDVRFTETRGNSVAYAPATFRDSSPVMSISVSHSGFNADITVADIDLRFLSDFLGEGQIGRSSTAYVVDTHGEVLARSSRGPEIGKSLINLPQVEAALKTEGITSDTGADVEGNSVLSTSRALPRLGWRVFFEQPTAQALAPIRDQLARGALLIALGLIVASLAGTVLARRMLIPITALRRGARRLGEGDFDHRIEVKTGDELEELAGQFNNMAGRLQETYAGLETKVQERTRDLAQSMNELSAAHSTVQQQAAKLEAQTEQLKDWNKSLEDRVQTQLAEIERIRKLERFLAPQVAQLIASSDGNNSLLDSHRREVTVVFCDLRGFTAFTEATEPEEAMNVLREYHDALGELTFKYEGTLDHYAGDGVMVLFNAPIQFADHTRRAVQMAVEMRDAIGALTVRWRNRGHNLGFGVGIAHGYATIGMVGFEHRLEYSAIGSVTNLASRLCDEAKAGQIVVSRRVFGIVEPFVEGRPIDDLQLKGFNHPVLAAEILRWRDEAEVAEAEAPAEPTARQAKQ
ncbi:adenylate/guanylate cyclase domain-containing protein [Bradyrhizobium sp.]|uniref:adenylate/guanylate cyclase domain-containing protein n=1 Tax=Bradyrhizobium sp. TaxID=376 RepID=UPI002D23579B|nr:adenylate/guanylate cyclase domain-containing protein [Bradyrhizobium sp.]HZR71440.1 adenylate/guanylate cyclase domain-containing protein [Bradyrhizobium sp.]